MTPATTSPLALAVAWVVFFAASVGGHLTMTIAAKAGVPRALAAVPSFLASPWLIATVASWGTSTVLWLVLLEAHGMARASSVSALRYVLIMAASWLVLREALSPRDVVGAALIAVGVFVMTR